MEKFNGLYKGMTIEEIPKEELWDDLMSARNIIDEQFKKINELGIEITFRKEPKRYSFFATLLNKILK